MCVPLIEAQVAVSKLLQQRPLNNALGRLILEEVDQSMLQTSILLGSGLLLGELIQARILFMEGLREQRGSLIVSFAQMLIVDKYVTALKMDLIWLNLIVTDRPQNDFYKDWAYEFWW